MQFSGYVMRKLLAEVAMVLVKEGEGLLRRRWTVVARFGRLNGMKSCSSFLGSHDPDHCSVE